MKISAIYEKEAEVRLQNKVLRLMVPVKTI
jgi:hypothetical protein